MSTTETEFPNKSTVAAMNRADLDVLATSLGLDPADYATRTDEIAAIEALRPGASTEGTTGLVDFVGSATLLEDGTPVYPPYMGIEPGVRPDTEPEPEAPLSGLQLIFDGEGDPKVGDTIAFNTGSEDPNEILRVWVAANDAEQTPLFSLDMPAGPGRTQPFTLGLTALWTEHNPVSGLGAVQLIDVDPETGEETVVGTTNFNVAGVDAPDFPG